MPPTSLSQRGAAQTKPERWLLLVFDIQIDGTGEYASSQRVTGVEGGSLEQKAIKQTMHKAEQISSLILKRLIFLNVISVFNNKLGK